MGLHYNPISDDVTLLNYMALYISIIGYDKKITNKKTGQVTTKRIYPSAKESLSLVGILTTDNL